VARLCVCSQPIVFCFRAVVRCKEEALSHFRTGDKQRAKQKLAMKRKFQKLLEQLDGRKYNVDEVVRGFTSAELNKVVSLVLLFAASTWY